MCPIGFLSLAYVRVWKTRMGESEDNAEILKKGEIGTAPDRTVF